MRRLALVLLLSCTAAMAADTARLIKRADRGEASARIQALQELAEADVSAALDKAQQWLAQETDARLRAAAARELWDLGDAAKPAQAALRAALEDNDEDVVYNAVGALDKQGVADTDLRPARLRIVTHSDDAFHVLYSARALYPDDSLTLEQYLSAAVDAIDLAAGERIADSITRSDLKEAAREGLLRRIAEKRGRAGFDALINTYARVSPPVREAIAYVLSSVPAEIGDPARVAALLDGATPYVRGHLLSALGRYGPRVQPVLQLMLDELDVNNEPDVRKSAAIALGYCAEVPGALSDQAKPSTWRTQVETRIAPALANAAVADPTPEVREKAADALESLHLWSAPVAAKIAAQIPAQDNMRVRYALVHVCTYARKTAPCPREVLQQLADSDPDQYVRRDAKAALVSAD